MPPLLHSMRGRADTEQIFIQHENPARINVQGSAEGNGGSCLSRKGICLLFSASVRAPPCAPDKHAGTCRRNGGNCLPVYSSASSSPIRSGSKTNAPAAARIFVAFFMSILLAAAVRSLYDLRCLIRHQCNGIGHLTDCVKIRCAEDNQIGAVFVIRIKHI